MSRRSRGDKRCGRSGILHAQDAAPPGPRFEGRPELSRRHFSVRKEDDVFTVTDLESSNGTSVEGVPGPVLRREFRDGDFIRSSGIVFLFVSA